MQKSQVTIKIVVFSVIGDKLKVFRQGSRLPDEIYDEPISLDKFALKVFKSKINDSVSEIFFEQLYTVSLSKGQMEEIDIIYYFLLPEHKIYSDKKNWYDTDSIKSDKNDKEVILYAVQRLRWKIEYTNVVYSLLPAEFTFSQLQKVYESILGRSLDKRNFRKKIISLNIIKPTGHIKNVGPARPAEMFVFKEKKLNFVKIL